MLYAGESVTTEAIDELPTGLAEHGGLAATMRGFGELEAVVMDRLWALGGSGTVREVLEQLRADREIAYTTVLSTMDNLHRKGHLTRKRAGKAYRYRTVRSHTEHTARLMRQALTADDDSEAVLAHLVGDMTEDELTRLQEVLARRTQVPDQ